MHTTTISMGGVFVIAALCGLAYVVVRGLRSASPQVRLATGLGTGLLVLATLGFWTMNAATKRPIPMQPIRNAHPIEIIESHGDSDHGAEAPFAIPAIGPRFSAKLLALSFGFAVFGGLAYSVMRGFRSDSRNVRLVIGWGTGISAVLLLVILFLMYTGIQYSETKSAMQAEYSMPRTLRNEHKLVRETASGSASNLPPPVCAVDSSDPNAANATEETSRPSWIDDGIVETTERGQRVIYVTVATDLYPTVVEAERMLPAARIEMLRNVLMEKSPIAGENPPMPYDAPRWEAARYKDWNQTSQGDWVRIYSRLRLDDSAMAELVAFRDGRISQARMQEFLWYSLGAMGLLGCVYGALKFGGRNIPATVDAPQVSEVVSRNE